MEVGLLERVYMWDSKQGEAGGIGRGKVSRLLRRARWCPLRKALSAEIAIRSDRQDSIRIQIRSEIGNAQSTLGSAQRTRFRWVDRLPRSKSAPKRGSSKAGQDKRSARARAYPPLARRGGRRSAKRRTAVSTQYSGAGTPHASTRRTHKNARTPFSRHAKCSL
jgi:hypothetical protein